jgi:hypothetical protein
VATTHLLILFASGELYGTTCQLRPHRFIPDDTLVFMLDMCIKQGIEYVKVQPG